MAKRTAFVADHGLLRSVNNLVVAQGTLGHGFVMV